MPKPVVLVSAQQGLSSPSVCFSRETDFAFLLFSCCFSISWPWDESLSLCIITEPAAGFLRAQAHSDGRRA